MIGYLTGLMLQKIGDWTFDNTAVIGGGCGENAYLTIQWSVNTATYNWTFIHSDSGVDIQMALAFVPDSVFITSTSTSNSLLLL